MVVRVVVYGAGAVGACYAYVLLKAGCDVTAICRSNYDAVKANGFTIDSEIWGHGLKCQPNVARTAEEAAGSGPFDYVLVTAKSIASSKHHEAIAPLVSKHTTVVLAQNGIGIEDDYARIYKTNPLLSCSVYIPVTQIEPGRVTGLWAERLEVGTFPAEAYEAEDTIKRVTDTWVELWKKGGGNPVFHKDVQDRRWAKLLLNVTCNPMCALTLCRDTALLGMGQDAVDVYKGVHNEVIAISTSLGYTSSDRAMADEQLQMSQNRVGTEGTEPSMLTDVLRGNRTEYEVILGNPLRIARELKIPVPRIELLYVLMKALDHAIAARKPGRALLGTEVQL